MNFAEDIFLRGCDEIVLFPNALENGLLRGVENELAGSGFKLKIMIDL